MRSMCFAYPSLADIVLLVNLALSEIMVVARKSRSDSPKPMLCQSSEIPPMTCTNYIFLLSGFVR